MEFDLEALIKALSGCGVQFVVIGGVAMAVHGSSYTTEDFDIAYARDSRNIAKLVDALVAFNPRLRVEGAPEGLPFHFDARTISNGGNFTLVTDAGNVDILAHVDGFKDFEEIREQSQSIDVFGCRIAVLSLDGLLRAKKAAGRPKDVLAIHEIEALKDAQGQRRSLRRH